MLALVTLVILVPSGGFLFGWWQYSRLPSVDVSAVLSPRNGRSGTNYLIVGTDSRAGIDASDPNASAFIASEVSGARTDTIMVLHLEGDRSVLTSIPRDLWVTDPATGQKGRINSTYASGPANLIRAVESLGVPVDHYLQIDFVAFGHLVDALGGITVEVAAPARDTHSGLSIERAGRVRMNGTTALAYVRSRYYEEFVDGRWRVDATSDLGRTERQRVFLTTVLHDLGSTRNPFVVVRVPGALRSGLVHVTDLGYLEALRLVWTMRSTDPATVTIPVTGRTTSGGAAVLELAGGSSQIVADLAR